MNDKDYDPFSYGQIRKQTGGGGESPEDMLFSGAGPDAARTGARDFSWDPPGSVKTGLSAVDFDADILGENSPVARPKAAAPAAKARPAAQAPRQTQPTIAKPAAKPTAAARTSATATKVTAAATTTRDATPAPARPVVKRSRTVPAIDPRSLPQRGKAGVAAPLLILAIGGAAAAWFYYGRQNVVMAGFAGALALALAGVAWFGMRR